MKSLFGFVAAVALAAGARAAGPAQDTFIAHRGESHDAPENTLPAYRMAVARGFGFECDVYLSADKQVFTFHDPDLTRTTAGACRKKCAEASWADEISKVDVGGWGKWKGSKFSPTRPALLSELLELAVDGRWIYVEVKAGPEIVPYVKEIFAKQSKATPRNTLFITGNAASGRALKAQMPDYRVLWVAGSWKGGAPTPTPLTTGDVLKVLKEMGADGVDMLFDPKVVTAAFVKTIRDAGYEFHAWTIDNLMTSLLAFERGAQTVTTNCAKRQMDEFKALDDWRMNRYERLNPYLLPPR